jgi:threonine dehydratase
LISTSAHADVIAGQGTAALELLHHTPDLDAIVCPIGGGGLLAGSCLAAEGCTRTLQVFGAEPAAADDAARSLDAGRLMSLPPQARSIADGLLVSLAPPAWDIIRTRAAGIVTVAEEEIRDAMHLVWERMKVVIEPSAAVAVAAVLSDRFRCVRGLDRVGIVLSGGNVKLDAR